MTTTPEFGDNTDEVGTDKKRLIIAGGLAAALVLGAGGFLLMSGGGEEDAGLVVPAAKRPAVTKPATNKVTKPVAKVPVISSANLGRDPFVALYIVPAVAVVPAVTSGTTPTSTTAGESGTGTSTGSGTSDPVTTTYALKLTRVYGSGKDLTGVFSVDGKTQLAKVGTVFGATQELKLLSLQQNAKGLWIAVLQVGDGDPFDAAAGSTYYVR